MAAGALVAAGAGELVVPGDEESEEDDAAGVGDAPVVPFPADPEAPDDDRASVR